MGGINPNNGGAVSSLFPHFLFGGSSIRGTLSMRRRSRPRDLDIRSTHNPPPVVVAILEAQRTIEGKHFIVYFVFYTTRRPRLRFALA